MKALKTSFNIEWRGLLFEGTAVYTPGDPGKLYGLPEKCYPPEPAEVEVLTMKNRRAPHGADAMFLFEGDDADDIADLVMEACEPPEPGDEDYEPTEQDLDRDALASAGRGTDEDYGVFSDADEG